VGKEHREPACHQNKRALPPRTPRLIIGKAVAREDNARRSCDTCRKSAEPARLAAGHMHNIRLLIKKERNKLAKHAQILNK